MADVLHLVCPECLAVNRLPARRLAEGPRCGQCGRALFSAHPVALTGAAFRKHVEHNEIPTVVDFWAPWCAPCRAMAPALEQAARELEPAVRLAKVDTEQEPALGAELGIRSIPTLVLYEHGREVTRRSGAMSASDIVRWISASSERG